MIRRVLWLLLAVVSMASTARAQWDDDPPGDDPPGTKRATQRPDKARADALAPVRVELVESTDARSVALSCDGVGADQQAAILAARWNCLAGFIDKFLSLTPEQKKAFEKSAAAFRADLDRYVSKPQPGSADGRSRGVKSTMRASDAEVRVTLIASLEFLGLVRALQERGILPRYSPLLVMVELAEGAQKNNNRMYLDLVVGHLTTWGWEVRDPDSLGEPGSAELAVDLLKMARLDSDIVIQLDVLMEKNGDAGVSAAVSLKAVEPTSGWVVAQAAVASPVRVGSRPGEGTRAAIDALNDATFQLWPQLFAYQKRLETEGKPLRVEFRKIHLPPKPLLDVIHRHCHSAKLLPKSGEDTVVLARCKPDNHMDIAAELEKLLERSSYKERYEFGTKAGHLIRVQLTK